MWSLSFINLVCSGCAFFIITAGSLERHLAFRQKLHIQSEKIRFLKHCGPLEQAAGNLNQACRFLIKKFPRKRADIISKARIIQNSLTAIQKYHHCNSGNPWNLIPSSKTSGATDRKADWPEHSFFYFKKMNKEYSY